MKKTVAILSMVIMIISLFCYNKAVAQSNLEFRGVWVATAYNIDWPIQGARDHYSKGLDLAKSLGLNTIVFQVRPMGDAFYKSSYSHWSKFLTGELGKNPGYDPLSFAIDEAHKRGLKFHAWFNPFRISADPAFDKEQYMNTLPASSPLKTKPEWIVRYEGGGKVYHWINPGIPEARQFVINMILEVVGKYNIDGVHIDDYFYPYPIWQVPFPDSNEYGVFGQAFSSIGDWRRDNVNKFIKDLNNSIKSTNSRIEFGISPFGIWKNGVSEGGAGTTGMSSFHELYCDTVKFIDNGWIDYVVPQIYWDFANSSTPYGTLTDWWADKVRGKKTRLYIGHAPYKIWTNPNEIGDQLKYNKTRAEVKGSCFFSLKDIRNNVQNVQQQLKVELNTAAPQLPAEEKPVAPPSRGEVKVTPVNTQTQSKPQATVPDKTQPQVAVVEQPKEEEPRTVLDLSAELQLVADTDNIVVSESVQYSEGSLQENVSKEYISLQGEKKFKYTMYILFAAGVLGIAGFLFAMTQLLWKRETSTRSSRRKRNKHYRKHRTEMVQENDM